MAEVLEIVREMENEDNFEEIIIKAAYLMGGLAWAQPFSGANKRTAILSASVFLRRNGLRLTIPKEGQKELRKMLFDVQGLRDKPNPEIIDELILYIKGTVVSL